MNTEETCNLNMPRYFRAKLTATGDGGKDASVEEVQQVIKFIDGYPCPPQWEKVRDVSEEEAKELGIFIKQKAEDETPMTTNDPQRDSQFSGFAKLLFEEIREAEDRYSGDPNVFVTHEVKERIAQRVYDLVEHTFHSVDNDACAGMTFNALIQLGKIPDLTEFPDESEVKDGQ